MSGLPSDDHVSWTVDLAEPELVLVLAALRAMAVLLRRETNGGAAATQVSLARASESERLAARLLEDCSVESVLRKAVDRVDARRTRV